MTLKFSKGSLASAVKSLPAETREASGELNISTVSIMISSRSVFLVEYIWGFLRPAESSFYVVEFSMLNGDLSKFCLYSSHRMAARRRIVMNQQPPEVPPSSHTTEPFRAKESLLIHLIHELCMPVSDSNHSGYIITTLCQLSEWQREDKQESKSLIIRG